LHPETPEEPGERLAAFRELLKRLKDHDVEFIVIGGLAAILQGAPVATYDVDVCAPMSDDNVAKIHAALREIKPRFRFRPDNLPVPDDPARLRGIRNMNLVTDVGVIDLLGDLPGVGTFEEVRDRTIEINMGGFVCRVLNLETLILSKKTAGRDKDLISVRHLEAILRKQQREPGLSD
jgi:predicted nucleotidyltransferase